MADNAEFESSLDQAGNSEDGLTLSGPDRARKVAEGFWQSSFGRRRPTGPDSGQRDLDFRGKGATCPTGPSPEL